MNKVEYLILRSALEFSETLKNVAEEHNISHAEVALAANCLFQNGDILAKINIDEDEIRDDVAVDRVRYDLYGYEGYPSPLAPFPEGGEDDNDQISLIYKWLIPNYQPKRPVVLTLSEIEASLKGKLGAWYYLTPQGGTRWELLTHPDWNRYHTQRLGCDPGEISVSEIVSPDRKFIEKFLNVDCYVCAVVHISGTEVWDMLEPWQATYWKILPRGYIVRYQSRQSDWHIDSDTSEEWIEANDQANEWYWEFRKWYIDPELE
ncbi:hypothetical protein N0Y54_05265 [Nostoc punctiforme UO1]|uniref:hypothetical protein n=1 Tax=Nostoc punctiforme TaxID=272131 RepID=UPI0030971C08